MTDGRRVKLDLTGATGFIARGVMEACADAGVACRALSRSGRPDWVPPAVAWRTVPSYADADALAGALSRGGCLLHLADNPARDAERSADAAARLCAGLIEAARRAGTARIIVASSVHARDAQAGPVSYGAAKRLVEQRFLAARGHGIDVVILRLPPVYGPGGAGGFAALSRLVARGVPLPFGRAAAPRAYLSRRNLAALLLAMAGAGDAAWAEASGRIFEPSDGEPIGTRDLVRAMAAQIGVAPRLLPVPPRLLRLLAGATRTGSLLSGALDELRVAPPLELERRFGWRPAERMPESLAFLAAEVRRA